MTGIRHRAVVVERMGEDVTTGSNRGLQVIPGVGPSIAADLEDLNIHEPRDLRHCDPEKMFDALCTLRGHRVDRCVLYVFRAAVYYASHEKHDPELLKWWNWKSASTVRRKVARPNSREAS